MSCKSYLLLLFQLFSITGLITLIVGINIVFSLNPYYNLTDNYIYTNGPGLLIVAGVFVLLEVFIGCYNAIKENNCRIVQFSLGLLTILVFELIVGISGLMKHDNLETSIASHLNKTISQYSTHKDVHDTFDVAQIDLKCCGIYGPDDWKNNSLPIPISCCGWTLNGSTLPCSNSTDLQPDGCLTKLVVYFEDTAKVLGGVGLGIAIVQFVGAVSALWLARCINSGYESL